LLANTVRSTGRGTIDGDDDDDDDDDGDPLPTTTREEGGITYGMPIARRMDAMCASPFSVPGACNSTFSVLPRGGCI